MKPHHPTPEAIELTEGEKDKIMNDFLLPTTVLENATLDELICLQLAASIAYELISAKVESTRIGPFPKGVTKEMLKVWVDRIDQAIKDTQFEGQQLPWKD